jgi:hypothetical protein
VKLGSVNMSPGLAGHNVPDGCGCDAVPRRERRVRNTASGVEKADTHYLLRRQFRRSASFAVGPALRMDAGRVVVSSCKPLGVQPRSIVIAACPGLGMETRPVLVPSRQSFGMDARSVAVAGRHAALCGSVAHVVSIGTGEQMGRITTSTGVAVVADEETGRDGSEGQFVGNAIRTAPAAIHREAAIALSELSGGPQPAGVRSVSVDLAPEPSDDFGGILRVHGKTNLSVSRPRPAANWCGDKMFHSDYSPLGRPIPA